MNSPALNFRLFWNSIGNAEKIRTCDEGLSGALQFTEEALLYICSVT